MSHKHRPTCWSTLTVVACTVASSALAGNDSVELRNGSLDMPTLGSAQLQEQVATLAARPDQRYTVVLLRNELAKAQRLALGREGVELLTCLGPRTWIAAVDARLAEGDARLSDRIAWMGELPTSAKLHPDLAAGIVPEWTIDRRAIDALDQNAPFDPVRLLKELDDAHDPVIAVYVLAHRNIDLINFADLITAELPLEVRSKIVTMNGLLVRLPMSVVDTLVAFDEVLWIEPALPAFAENNNSNRLNTQVEEIWAAPYSLSGSGVVAMVYDGGIADSSHPDFSGRLTTHDSSGTSSHATHVSGTVGGDGTNSAGLHAGMAPGCTIVSYGFEQEGGLNEGFLYTDPGDIEVDYTDAILTHGAVVANNSIGTNTAPNGYPCEWTGDYGVTSGVIDSVVRGALGDSIRIVWANGNERQTTRCGDLYNTTAPPACAKNHITVGALNSNDDSVTTFTSFGPSDDGRIKPDISAPGCQSDGDTGVTSTTPGGGYSSYCGTSMAAPTVTGIAALIIEEWRQLHPGEADISNAGLKALLANSGDDLGNVGPDCQFGFGTVRARAAIDSLRAEGVIESEVIDGSINEHLVIVEAGQPQLRITLAWDDEPASPLPTLALVNDLDLRVTDPAGNVIDPWTIDPANPGLAATRSGPDRLNNMEQVSVQNPMSGAWRVQIVGHAIPVGPQTYALAADPNPIACSSTGVVGFGGQRVQPDTIVSISVVDCDLNTNDEVTDTIAVSISSDDDPLGFDTVLSEDDPASSSFSGSIQLSTIRGGTGLYALDGSQIRVVYIDEMDASGNVDIELTATALVDGTISPPTSVDVPEFGPDSATVQITSDEPVRVTIRYGLSCDALNDEVSRSGYDTDQAVTISGLEDTYTYYFRIDLTDQAGNTETYGDGADCFSFTVPDALDFYAEGFSSGIDLVGYSLRFVPIGGADVYAPCAEPISALPIDPSGGSNLTLSDDSNAEVSIPFEFEFYNEFWSSVFVGSNGYATFGTGRTAYSESMSEHFGLPGISALFDDLNPSAGGTVSTRSVAGAFAITWEDVAEYSTTNQNTFQIVLYQNGEVQIAWTEIALSDAIIGISPGGGLNSAFIPSDFSESSLGCLPRPPAASDINLVTAPGTSVDITLAASDDGLPLSLVYVIDSLPIFDLRDLSTGELITSVPHTIETFSGPHLRYEPSGFWEGSTSFQYFADDGGSPPEGGPSNIATVSIAVASGPSVVYDFSLDKDPGFILEGDWGFGQPSGGGGEYGSPDPTSGYTGSNVLGYNLAGDYGSSIPEYSATLVGIDCSGLSGVTLRFQRWLNVETSQYDHAYIRVSADGGTSYQTIWENTATLENSAWELMEYDLSAIADDQSDVRIRWVMGTTDGSWQYSGWNIDDIQIIANAPPQGVPGDLNGDGGVDGADLTILLAEWGFCPGCVADFNGDGFVDGADLTTLLGYWGSGSLPLTDLGDREPDRAVDAPTNLSLGMPLINDDRLAPGESGGLVIAPHGYIQTPDALLEIELMGDLPIDETDLVLVGGRASLAGRLEVHVDFERAPVQPLHVIMLGDEIAGSFDQVRFLGSNTNSRWLCQTDRALVLVSDAFPGNGPDEAPALVSEALELIDAIGTNRLDWDLDGDGVVGFGDLQLLIVSGAHCE